LIDIRAMAFMEFAFLSIRHFIASIKAKKKKQMKIIFHMNSLSCQQKLFV